MTRIIRPQTALVVALAAAALVPAAGAEAAVPDLRDARTGVSVTKNPPRKASVQRTIQRLLRNARIPKPKRTAQKRTPSGQRRQGTAGRAFRSTLARSYIPKGCAYSNYNYYRTCVWQEYIGSGFNGWIVEDHQWVAYRGYVIKQKWFCGSPNYCFPI